ncbi:unnamed protein product, partial [Brassica oleracea]
MKDREARANVSDGTSGAGPSKGKEIDGREGGDGKSLVAYTGAPSNRGNYDQEYLRRSDLDALIKLFKEHGNTFAYSFGARAIENDENLTRTDRMHESVIDMLNQSRTASFARNDHVFKPSSILAHIASSHTIKPLVVDSGASHHMISDTSLIKDIVPMNGNVMIDNGDKIPIRGIGSLKLFGKETKAFYMPEFTSNLLSVKKCATDLQCNVIFSPNDVKFQDIKSSKMIGKGVTKGELYLLKDLAPVSSYSCSFTSVSGS